MPAVLCAEQGCGGGHYKRQRPTRDDVLGVVSLLREPETGGRQLDSGALALSSGDTNQSEKTGSEQPYCGWNRHPVGCHTAFIGHVNQLKCV